MTNVIPLITHFDATDLSYFEASAKARSLGWKASALKAEGDRIIARQLSERTIAERLREYRNATR